MSFTRVKWFSALLGSFMLFAGCTSVSTDVKAYSTLSSTDTVGSIYISPYANEDASSLQWRADAGVLRGVLEEKGFTVVDKRKDASSVMYVGFLVDDGETVQSTYSIPQYGVTGYSGAYTTGSLYGNMYSATTTYTPTYGVTGYTTGVSTSTVYTRGMALDMVDAKTNEKQFEAVSISRGSCASFSGVARPIIEATLSNFPAGKIGNVDVVVDETC